MSSIETPIASIDSFDLPCGYLDPNGDLHTSVDVNGITGEEEEILAAPNMPVTKKLNKLLSNCVTRIGTYTWNEIERLVPDLTQGDRVYLIMAIRRVSLGNDMPFVTKCPECEKEAQVFVDLGELEVKKMKDPKVRVYEETLPHSKMSVRMKVLTGRGEEAISKASQSRKDLVSTAILCRVETLAGKPATLADIKKLSLADRNFLKDLWQENEGGVETDVKVECPACDAEYETGVDMGAMGFFNPSAALKSWKKKSST